MLFALAPDDKFQKLRQRIDNGYTDAMQATRNLIGIIVAGVFKLPASVQLRHDDFGGGNAFFGVHPSWNTAAVILN